MLDMPSESIIMPHVPTPVIGTRPRLGFSIESLVGNNNNTDITSPSSLSPPLSGMTKLPDSPIATDNSQFIFSTKDLFMQAREQQIKEQFLRTQIFREQIAREQMTREQITRDQITREQITREQLLRGQMQAQHEQHKLILRDESASREIREFENRLLGSPGTPTRSVSPLSHYEEDAKKSSPPLALSPVQQSMLPQVFPGNMGMPFGSHILSMNNNNIFQPHLGASPLLPSHPHMLSRSLGHPLGTPLPPTQTSKEYPLYPWLMTAHQGRFFPQVSEFPTFLLPFRKPKRIRTAFSPSQLLRLEQAFEKNQYVVGAERKQLAQTLSLSETQVKVWFQNRRTKHKRQQQEGDEGTEEGSKKRNNDEGFILEHEEDEELDIENEAVGL